MKIPRSPSFRLDGRRALVVGGTGGIGFACAAALAENGASVMIASRRPGAVESAAASLGENGYAAEGVAFDAASEEEVRDAVRQHGPFAIVVNSAGIARPKSAFDTGIGDFDDIMDANVRAAFIVAREAARGMRIAGGGSIIQISSQMGLVGGQDRSVYCASKHAVEGMTKAMAIEWGPHGVRVNTICPTFIRTELTAPTFDNPERVAWIKSKIKLGRIGVPEDIMGAVQFLASDASAMDRNPYYCRRRMDGGMTREKSKHPRQSFEKDANIEPNAHSGSGPYGRVTSHDVARLAGVSQSAVSRAFSPGASVSPKTLEKVMRVADSLGYRPNVIARSLITGRSRTIGMVVAYLGNSFYSAALESLSLVLQSKGYHVLVFMASNTAEELDRVVNALLDYQVDGIIAASVSTSNTLSERCRAAGIPLVLFNRHQGKQGPTAVTSDNYDGAKQIAHFLANAGCRRIAHITGWSESSTGIDREAGFGDGLAEAGLELHGRIDGRWNRNIAAEAARSLFSSPANRPDGVFVGNDHMAFAVMDVLRCELGLRVPEDVSVVGYDDAPQAGWKAYDLTTFRQPVEEMVDLTVNILLARIENSSTDTNHFTIPGHLVVRQSAKIPGHAAND